MKKGFIVFYINYFPEQGQNVDDTINLIRNQNKALLDKLKEDGEYDVMFVPTVKEASRVEKVDFGMPFPRFVPNATKLEPEGAELDNQED
jgi:hypothetical protein